MVHRVVDVTSTEQVDSWIRDVMETFGKLDGAANVAGVGIMKATSIVDTTDKEWDFCMGVNATGVQVLASKFVCTTDFLCQV